MDDDVIVRREERGLISVLTMEYRPYNLLGPTLIGAIATEVTAAHETASRAIILRSGLRHFSAGADVALFGSRIEQGGRSQTAISVRRAGRRLSPGCGRRPVPRGSVSASVGTPILRTRTERNEPCLSLVT